MCQGLCLFPVADPSAPLSVIWCPALPQHLWPPPSQEESCCGVTSRAEKGLVSKPETLASD